ncbi:hypothetical protein BKA67DRAFT_542027 [Truncatella angustata]|uniref:SnoaL-like domain-containing protein n=1 Tax=Truncatella angustata TaxID=152316 RepID=A0A9P8RKW9_9PEZI|nr:uncharacterized protein BKA67DRAFT_542027 [Truncatella angustata]KAH6645041.1 hypothetical protein BKA67DRAFT_542027 [Truncatella angustata]
MATIKVTSSADETEKFLSKVFEILDSYDYDRFQEVFSADLEFTGGLWKDTGRDNFVKSLRKQMQIAPPMKTWHVRDKNDVASDGTIYSSGRLTTVFEAHPDSPITIPMIGVFTMVADGPECGKIKNMAIHKDRVPFIPFIQKLPGMA